MFDCLFPLFEPLTRRSGLSLDWMGPVVVGLGWLLILVMSDYCDGLWVYLLYVWWHTTMQTKTTRHDTTWHDKTRPPLSIHPLLLLSLARVSLYGPICTRVMWWPNWSFSFCPLEWSIWDNPLCGAIMVMSSRSGDDTLLINILLHYLIWVPRSRPSRPLDSHNRKSSALWIGG